MANYQTYLEHLAIEAKNQAKAVEKEQNIYPLFADLKRLVNHYKNTIEKFANIQQELVNFFEKLRFSENDFDYYQDKFLQLQEADKLLQELKAKKVSASVEKEIQTFISQAYKSTSIYDVGNLENKILSYHNKAAEATRADEASASNMKALIVVGIILFLIIFLIIKCNS